MTTPQESFWAATAQPRRAAPALHGDQHADVAIIGGGLTGLSAALHLGQSGSNVTLIEAQTIGYGGSGRNNGQVIPTLAGIEPDALIRRHGEAGEQFVHLVRDSADDLFKLVRQYNIDCDAEQAGWFQPAHSPDHLRLSESRVKAWQKHGAPAELLDKPAGDALLGSAHWHGGMLNPTGGHIHPLKLVHGLADVTKAAGVTIYENTPATRITRHNNRWQITIPNGFLTADAILLATNAYTGPLVPKIQRSIVPITAWQLATPPLSADQCKAIIPARQAVSDTRGDLWYFRYTADNRLVTGSALMLNTKARQRLQPHIAKRMQAAFPQLGKLDFSHIWNGYVGITADFTPRFHMLGPNYYAFTGYNGRGLALTLAIGREFAKAINGQENSLPFDSPRTIPLHGLVRHVARSRLILTRLKDRQPPKETR